MRKIINALKHRMKGICNIIWFTLNTANTRPPRYEWDSNWKKIPSYLEEKGTVNYHLEILKSPLSPTFKWVGGSICQNKIVGIPTGEKSCLVIDLADDTVSKYGELSDSSFKWSGSCVWNNCVYGFPRTSNELLCVDFTHGVNIICKPLPIHYSGEHHYGGVCTHNGIVYQPPRNTGTILKIDLNTGETRELHICKGNRKFRYCGSILHPNGLIYFLPEYMERVMVLDPLTDKIYFIGKCLSSMVFGASIGLDGNIYGFSAYGKGILKIDVINNAPKVIFSNVYFGSYGSSLGLNGKIIGIPGCGNKIFSFDPFSNELELLSELPNDGYAKCAGSVTAPDGSIYCIPAMGTKIYALRPDKKCVIPNEMIESCYLNGCY